MVTIAPHTVISISLSTLCTITLISSPDAGHLSLKASELSNISASKAIFSTSEYGAYPTPKLVSFAKGTCSMASDSSNTPVKSMEPGRTA